MKKYILKISLMVGVLACFTGCTDLELEDTDSVSREDSGEGVFTGVTDVTGSLTNAYNSIRGQLESHENLFALNEATSDELLIPTRGTDWGDNGVWRTLHQHTWDSNHPFVLNTWNQYNSNIFNLSEIIAPESNASAQQLAEAKFLRAFSMYWIMDLYGQVPFRGVSEGPSVNPRILTRAEAFEFVLQDLNEALPNLPVTGPGLENNLANKAAGHYLLAKLFLNKHIYLGTGEAAPADMNEVIKNVNAIDALGFGLQSGYFEIFEPAVDSETIWYTTSGVGNRMWSGLHYNQTSPGNTGGGWNGFTTLSEFYNLFEGPSDTNVVGSGQEERRGFVPTEGTLASVDSELFPNGGDSDEDGFIDASDLGRGFLVGQQYDLDGSLTPTRSGDPLQYSKELPGLLGNTEETGIRILKYHPSNGAFTGHLVVFRYADALLMKAEAILRGGSSDETALGIVNELREIRLATPLESLAEQDLLDERGRELYQEYWRRQDQIRFGTFTDAWEFKENTEEFRVLFPIPSVALTSNPNLTQNPGYN